jgi:hypothetical protein
LLLHGAITQNASEARKLQHLIYSKVDKTETLFRFFFAPETFWMAGPGLCEVFILSAHPVGRIDNAFSCDKVAAPRRQLDTNQSSDPASVLATVSCGGLESERLPRQ